MPNTDHLDPNYGKEHRSRSRRSSSIPSALWMILGALAALLIVLATRGPATVVVQSGNNCCCCNQTAPCNPAGAAETPIVGDRIGKTPVVPPAPPLPAPGTLSPDPTVEPTPNTTTTSPIARIIPFVPFLPWSSGGDDPDTPNTRGKAETPGTPVPEPGSIALIALGAVTWRLLA